MDTINEELFETTRENNRPEVSRLLSVGADVNAKNSSDSTHLHWAGNVQVVKELLARGADTEVKDDEGLTSLHWACAYSHMAVVIELLSGGRMLKQIIIEGILLYTWPASLTICPL
jgi:ankyrin repeat protein